MSIAKLQGKQKRKTALLCEIVKFLIASEFDSLVTLCF